MSAPRNGILLCVRKEMRALRMEPGGIGAQAAKDHRAEKKQEGGLTIEYPIKRELCGTYFRVERNGKWENVCFSDLTLEERFKVMEGRSVEWLKSMCVHLANTVQLIGTQFDITAKDPD